MLIHPTWRCEALPIYPKRGEGNIQLAKYTGLKESWSRELTRIYHTQELHTYTEDEVMPLLNGSDNTTDVI